MTLLEVGISGTIFLYLILFKKDRLMHFMFGFLFIGCCIVYLDETFIERPVKYEYGCVVKRNINRMRSAYLFINVDSRFKRFSLSEYASTWNDEYIGKCLGFYYYKNLIGRNVIIDFVD